MDQKSLTHPFFHEHSRRLTTDEIYILNVLALLRRYLINVTEMDSA